MVKMPNVLFNPVHIGITGAPAIVLCQQGILVGLDVEQGYSSPFSLTAEEGPALAQELANPASSPNTALMTSYGPGNPAVFGATPVPGGCSFSLFSRHATAVELLLFDAIDAKAPSTRIAFDPIRHRTGDVWHVHVPGVKNGQLYGYLVDGPWAPDQGHRFNKHKLLLDPYAKAIAAATRGTSRQPIPIKRTATTRPSTPEKISPPHPRLL